MHYTFVDVCMYRLGESDNCEQETLPHLVTKVSLNATNFGIPLLALLMFNGDNIITGYYTLHKTSSIIRSVSILTIKGHCCNIILIKSYAHNMQIRQSQHPTDTACCNEVML